MGDLTGHRVGNYQILEMLGQGSMGIVYRARQISMDRDVALKVLPSAFAQDAEYVRRFVAEARAAGQINHPNIVGVHDVVKFSDTYAFSMDYVDGPTAQKIIDERGTFTESEALLVAKQIAEALSAAHAKSIIHRDVKPDNMMIASDGVAKLADLGLARRIESGEPRRTAPGSAVGTPYYMAPEEAKGESVDYRADIYSLGASLFHMVTGRPPYEGPSANAVMIKHATEKVPDAREVNPRVSLECARLIKRMLAKSPAGRPASAREVVSLIDKLDAAQPAIHGTAKYPRVGETRRRVRTASTSSQKSTAGLQMAIGIAAGLVLVVGVIVFLAGGSGDSRRAPAPAGGGKTGTGTVPGPAGGGAEDLARAARSAYRELDAWVSANPEDLSGQMQRLEGFIDKFPLSEEASLARQKAEILRRGLREQASMAELDALITRARAKADSGRYGEGMKLLAEAAAGSGDAALKAKAACEEIALASEAKYAALKAEAEGLAGSGRFDDAKAAMAPVIRDFGIEDLAAKAREDCARYDRAREQAAAAGEKKTLEEAEASALDLAAKHRYAAARDALAAVAAGLKSEELRARAKLLATDLDRAEKAYSQAKTRIELGSQTKLTRVGLGTRGSVLEMTDSGVKVDRGGAEAVIPWNEVTPRSFLLLVQQNMMSERAEDLMHVGVLGIFARAWPEARESLLKALTLDPTLQAEVDRYLAIVEPRIAASAEEDAAALFEKVKQNAESGLQVKAAALAKELKENYSATQFVKTHAAEIDALVGAEAASAGASGSGTASAAAADPQTELKKLGWETVTGTWKSEKKDMFAGEGTVRLEAGSQWKNAVVSVDAQLDEGDQIAILIRYDESQQQAVDNLRNRARGWNPLGPEYDVPQGYGVLVGKDSVRIVDGGQSPFGNFGRGGRGGFGANLDGLPRAVRTVDLNGRQAHNYTVQVSGEDLTVLVDGRQVYKTGAVEKRESGSVIISTSGGKVQLHKPQVKQLTQ